ncbi:uncharacterized protein K452DRAFT_64641 [Aplosporella prunicola CBS 121167]|uniref:Uncharacterized protein n=1 Tax=Aplosporella prunicola CBS 121167 TaxID=1176127 RepID=A0A6A6B6H0_9PEZI|nr:uncharacterized protein K452DRAFT_64641 [Aplosporella prunicola CBS 121167]KAF2139722.1 hypothetical protein K452DRAFT_64641 [Aplosporella prunicola CBS 121167]
MSSSCFFLATGTLLSITHTQTQPRFPFRAIISYVTLRPAPRPRPRPWLKGRGCVAPRRGIVVSWRGKPFRDEAFRGPCHLPTYLPRSGPRAPQAPLRPIAEISFFGFFGCPLPVWFPFPLLDHGGRRISNGGLAAATDRIGLVRSLARRLVGRVFCTRGPQPAG